MKRGGRSRSRTVSVRSQSGAKCADTRASAVVIRTFFDNTRSQLTYKGLFNLASLPTQSAGFSISTSEPTVYPFTHHLTLLLLLSRSYLHSRSSSHSSATHTWLCCTGVPVGITLDLSATNRLRRTGIARNGSPFGCLAQPSVLLLHYLYCTDTSFGSIATRISIDDKILHVLSKVTQYSYSPCITVLAICCTYQGFSLITKTRSSPGQLQVHGLQKQHACVG